MKQTPALFSYRAGNSVIHKLPAFVKLLLLLFITFRTFSNSVLLSDYMPLIRSIFYFVVSLVLFVLAKTPLKNILKLRFIFILGILLILISLCSFNLEAIKSDALYILRFFTTALASLVVFETTSKIQIFDLFSLIEEKLSKLFPILKKMQLAFILSITISFIPEVFNCWNKITLSAKARTLENKKGKRTFSVYSLQKQFDAFFLNMLLYAEEVRKAVSARM